MIFTGKAEPAKFAANDYINAWQSVDKNPAASLSV